MCLMFEQNLIQSVKLFLKVWMEYVCVDTHTNVFRTEEKKYSKKDKLGLYHPDPETFPIRPTHPHPIVTQYAVTK